MSKLFTRSAVVAIFVGTLFTAHLSLGQEPECAGSSTGSQSASDPSSSATDMPYASAAMPSQPQAAPHYLFVAPSYRGYGHPVAAQTYAYGWFGACSKSHAVFHWDYFNNCWIWW